MRFYLNLGLAVFLVLMPMLYLMFFYYYRKGRSYGLECSIHDATRESIGISILVFMYIEGIGLLLHLN